MTRHRSVPRRLLGLMIAMALIASDWWYVYNRLENAGYLLPTASHAEGGLYIMAAFGAAVAAHVWLIAELWRVRGRVSLLSVYERVIDLALLAGVLCMYLPTSFWQSVARAGGG